ncbi:MAG: polymerase-like protein [Cyanobacteria bacterium RYN_339]|nr:polymerase-like protein [Cyanobacteria bacterium RYN_339]
MPKRSNEFRAEQHALATARLASQVVLVEEAPGEQEDRQRLPFVGRSGSLLDRGACEGGPATRGVLDRQRREVPARASRSQPGTAWVVKAWLILLAAELGLTRLGVVVALGALAAIAHFGAGFKITQQRGPDRDASFREVALDLDSAAQPS